MTMALGLKRHVILFGGENWPPYGTPSLILDFVADGNDPWPTLSLDFSADAYRVDEGDPTAGNEHINIQVWS